MRDSLNMNAFKDPDMRCKEGHRIPRNGDAYKVDGKEKLSLRPLLACPECAREAGKHMPKAAKLPKLRQGEKDERQVSFLTGHDGVFIK